MREKDTELPDCVAPYSDDGRNVRWMKFFVRVSTTYGASIVLSVSPEERERKRSVRACEGGESMCTGTAHFGRLV